MARHRFAFATREWQRDSMVAALDGATFTHRSTYRSYGQRRVYEEEQPLVYTISRTSWCGVKVWAFNTTRVEAAEAGRRITDAAANGWFQPGERVVYVAAMADGTPEGTPLTIVAQYAGDTYIRRDGASQALKEDGTPDLYRTKMVGPWWLDREEVR